MASLGTVIGENLNKYSGLSTLDAGLTSFTNKDIFKSISNGITTDGSSLRVNNTTTKVQKDQAGVLTSSFNDTVKSIDNTINISKYTVPTRLALDSFANLGHDIDKSLKGSFLLQKLNIKGTDILCSTFCFLISLLSCRERGEIYDALEKANKASRQMNEAVSAANNIINTVGAVMASGDAITRSANNLFSGKGTMNDLGVGINAGATIAAAPDTINKNIKKINDMFKLGAHSSLMIPSVSRYNIWDMSSNVLHCLQAQAVQAADEAISRITKPVEDAIRGITPQPCFGTMAVRLQTAIIAEIEKLKQWMLIQVANLFNSNADFQNNFMKKVSLSTTALEMMAFTNCLTKISAHFFDIARSCGIAPCTPNIPLSQVSKEASNFNNRQADQVSTLPSYVNGVFPKPNITGDNIEDLSNKMAPTLALNTDAPQVFITPDEILSVNTIPTSNIPNKIKDLIDRGALDPALDNNYTIYTGSDDIKVVYRYDRKCGEK